MNDGSSRRSTAAGSWPGGTFVERLPAQVREIVLARCRPVLFAPGQYLLRQGDRDRRAFVILDGVIKIRVVDPVGIVATLAMRRPGDIVGELGALTGEPRIASAVAATPVRGGLLGGSELAGILSVHPVAVHELVRAQRSRRDWSNRRRLDVVARPPRWKIARALSDLASEDVEQVSAVTVHLSQHELASLVGVGLNTAEAALRSLAADGLVVRGYRQLTIPDPERLRTFAEGDPQNP